MRASAQIRTGTLLLAVGVTLVLGTLLKAQPSFHGDAVRTPCLEGASLGAARFTRLCYSDSRIRSA